MIFKNITLYITFYIKVSDYNIKIETRYANRHLNCFPYNNNNNYYYYVINI